MDRRVLVVDDDVLVLEVVASMLEELGYETALVGREPMRLEQSPRIRRLMS